MTGTHKWQSRTKMTITKTTATKRIAIKKAAAKAIAVNDRCEQWL